MINELPIIDIPELLTQLCSMELKNTKSCHADISLLVDKDSFFKIYVREIFPEYNKKGGTIAVLSSLGWQGFRNRLAEAFLNYAQHGSYPKVVNLNVVKSVIEFERRFDFVYSETNSRVFLLGLYLKLCQIELEKKGEYQDTMFSQVPSQVDEILKTGKSRSKSPDWLIVIVWSFFSHFGKPRSLEFFNTHKCDLEVISKEIKKSGYIKFIQDLLVYGHAIDDIQFFTETTI